MLKAIVAATLVGLVLAGCSAGGQCEQGTCKGTTNNNGGTTTNTAPTMTVTLSSSTVTTGAPATVTATLDTATGSPIAGNVVSFNVSPSVGLLSATSALTDSNGRAVVLLSPAVASNVGADTVTATTSVAGTVVTGSAGYQTSAVTAALGAFTTDATASKTGKLAAYGQAGLTLTITGVSPAAPASVTVTSDCVSRGKASISPASTTNTTGTATFIYKDTGGCGSVLGSDTVSATITGSSASPVTVSVPLTSPVVSSLTFKSASPTTIYLKGSGYVESSTVQFEVVDTAGNPLPGQVVDLTLSTFAGGLTLDQVANGAAPDQKTSDANGIVSAIINSGTVPTPVRVIASLDATPAVSTVSSNLAIVTGLPAQLQFSLSQTTINIEGNDIDGTPNNYTVRAADRSGNPVPDGTSVIYWSEGGQIQGTAATTTAAGISSATANFVSAAPRPQDGRSTIVAYAIGEESFIDQNGDNVWQTGEPFQDLGDVYKDVRFDGIFDSSVDEFVSLSQLNNTNNTQTCVDQSGTYPQFVVNKPDSINGYVPSRPNTCDGTWSGKTYVRRAVETVFSTSYGDLLWAGKSTHVANEGLDGSCVTVSKLAQAPTINATPTTYYPVYRPLSNFDQTWYTAGQFTGTISFVVGDQNSIRLNPMAAGTTISVLSGTPGFTVLVFGGSPVANSATATTVVISYQMVAITAGTFGLTVKSPSGATSTYSINVNAANRPSLCTL